jgi:hypothetical protein
MSECIFKEVFPMLISFLLVSAQAAANSPRFQEISVTRRAVCRLPFGAAGGAAFAGVKNLVVKGFRHWV